MPSEEALRLLEKAKTELAEKRQAYKSAIALLHQLRLNIKIKEHVVLILEQNYKDALESKDNDLFVE
jgi:hypothetical protein